jgi:hypothetical protein
LVSSLLSVFAPRPSAYQNPSCLEKSTGSTSGIGFTPCFTWEGIPNYWKNITVEMFSGWWFGTFLIFP